MSATCGTCADFVDDPREIERAIAGLAALGSAHGANRADDGLCTRHDRTLRASASCALHTPRA